MIHKDGGRDEMDTFGGAEFEGPQRKDDLLNDFRGEYGYDVGGHVVGKGKLVQSTLVGVSARI